MQFVMSDVSFIFGNQERLSRNVFEIAQSSVFKFVRLIVVCFP